MLISKSILGAFVACLSIVGINCQKILSCDDILQLSQDYFGDIYLNDMVCIATQSSGLDPYDENSSHSTTLLGLWQLDTQLCGKTCDCAGNDLIEPTVNAKCAAHVLEEYGLNYWEIYNSGVCDSWGWCVLKNDTSSTGRTSTSTTNSNTGSLTSTSSSTTTGSLSGSSQSRLFLDGHCC